MDDDGGALNISPRADAGAGTGGCMSGALWDARGRLLLDVPLSAREDAFWRELVEVWGIADGR